MSKDWTNYMAIYCTNFDITFDITFGIKMGKKRENEILRFP